MEYRELFYEALSLNSPVAIVTMDHEGKVNSCNPAFEKLFGYSQSEIIGQYLDPLISTPDMYFEMSSYTKRNLERGETIRTSGKRRKKDGALIEVEIQGIPIVSDQKSIGILALYHDITDRVRAEESLRDLYSSFIHIMDSIDADVYVADINNYEIIFMNQHMRDNFGGDQVGKACWKVFRNETKPCVFCTNDKLLDAHGSPLGEVVWEGQNPITKRWYKNFDRAIAWGDGRYVRLQVATDITDLKEAEQRLHHLATHDPLTDLPNRMYFLERISQLVNADQRENSGFAVVFLDIDNFKPINDRFGHRVGDQLLIEASKRMKTCLREKDLVSRVSGDEFTFILAQIAEKAQAARVAERIMKSISLPYFLDGHTIKITVSMGISIYPDDGTDPDQLLQRSDEAMYQIKKTDKDGFAFYGARTSDSETGI